MPRGKEVLPAAASISFQYHSVSDMPWSKIESAAGKAFSDTEKQEILRCADGFDWEYSYLSEAPLRRDVDALRSELLKHCKALVELAEKFPPKELDGEKGYSPGVVSALQIYYGTEAFSFRDEYDALARISRLVAEGLGPSPAYKTDTLASSPETAGLNAFLGRVLDGAEKTIARSKQGHEYRRWGLTIGPRAKRFPAFVSAVLDREVTEGALRKAWPSH